jgi:hypothetical protein
MGDLTELLAKVRGATELPSRGLDGEICLALGWTHEINNDEDYECWRDPDGRAKYLPRLTSSVDAALALVDQLFPFGPMVGHEMTGSLARDGQECFNFRIRVYSDEEGEPATIHWATSYQSYPLAIIEALLSALNDEGKGR